MRPLLKYGVPLAGGVAAAGGALAQGEDPGSAVLAGLAGGVGAAGGLLAARKLAGKFAPDIRQAVEDTALSAAERLQEAKGGIPSTREQGMRAKALGKAVDVASSVTAPSERALGKGIAAGIVPGSIALAGLGGVAAGAIPGYLGVPGFQQGVVDPESYGSSNSPGARYKAPTMQYT